MAGLEPPKDEELFQALVADGFEADELKRAGAVFSRGQFDIMMPWEQPLQRILQAALALLGQYGPPAIIRMIQGAILVRSVCPRLRSFCQLYYPDGLLPLPADVASRIS